MSSDNNSPTFSPLNSCTTHNQSVNEAGEHDFQKSGSISRVNEAYVASESGSIGRGSTGVSKKQYAPGTSSLPKAAFNFINSIVGAGIIGMPYAFGECGILGGLCGCMLVSWLVSRSVQMLIECGVKVNRLDYEELAKYLLGKKGYYAALASMFLFAFGAQIAYLVIIGDTIPVLTGLHREFTIGVVSLFMILPLSLLKDMSMLSYTSLAAITADILIIVLVILTAPKSAYSQNIHPSLGKGTLSLFSSRMFAGIGTLSFAFVCMHNSFIVYRSLEVRTEENWNVVSRGSVFFCFVLATIFGMAGYISFGDRIEGDILNNFIVERKPIDWARGFLACCMIFVYPMEMFVSRHCLMSLMNDIDETSRNTGDVEAGKELIGNCSTHSMGDMSGHEQLDTEELSSNAKMAKKGKQTAVSASVTEDDDDDLDDSDGDEVIEFPLKSVLRNQQAEVSTQSMKVGSSSPQHFDKGLNQADSASPRDLAQCFTNTVEEALLFLRAKENKQHVGITVAVWITTTLLAMAFDDLGVVLALTGAVAASCLGYVLPAIIYLASFQDEFDVCLSKAQQAPNVWDMVEAMCPFLTPLFMIGFGLSVALVGSVTVFMER